VLIVAIALGVVVLLLAGPGGDAKGGDKRPGASTSAGRSHGEPPSGSASRSGAGVRAPVDAEAVESPEIRHLISLDKPIYCAAPHGNEVALTFDDGPGTYTRLAIVKLRKHRIKATFFVVGRNIALLPAALGEERALGAVGDHTFTHPLLTSLAPAEAREQIVRTKRDLERASGGPVFLFRPPYGAHDATIDSIARRNGLLEILWTVDSRDSLGANYAQIERTVIAGMKPGAIVLMHENHGQTIRAMLNIFAALKRKHLRPVSVARLLTDDPPSDARVRAGVLGCGEGASAGSGGG
jgi:peptidoglycan/xylan/chitin deacetylase (PgdA/CDA1 family)